MAMAKIAVLVVVQIIYGCGASSNSALLASISDDNSSAVELELTKPITRSRLNQLKSISVPEFYQSLLSQSSDEPFVFGGQTISGVRTQLQAAAPFFTRLATRYKSWGDFAVEKFELATAPGQHITREVFAKLTGAFKQRSGVFAKIKIDPSKSKSKQEDRPADTLELAETGFNKANIAALAAMSLAIKHGNQVGLGLATNSVGEEECKKMTDMSAVSRLDYFDPVTKSQKICTGTFFRGDAQFDYMLTAAHCTENGKDWNTLHPKGYRAGGIVLRNATAPGSAANPPKPVPQPVGSSADISVVAFPRGTARGYMDIASVPPQSFTAVTVAGYGKVSQSITSDEPAGNLRCGSNVIFDSVEQQGVISLTGLGTARSSIAPPGKQSLAAPGDSGGPLIRIRDDGRPEIIGVAAMGGGHNGLPAEKSSYSIYTSVNSSWSKPFIKQRSVLKWEDFPFCTNGSNNGQGLGQQAGIGGPDGSTCRVPAPDTTANGAGTQGQPGARRQSDDD
ncbi:MAG: S1 family peptidase [Deltaproteobacteria bacterium]|nr:S1 family peptidase [Deltaproteobacteria bacterium]